MARFFLAVGKVVSLINVAAALVAGVVLGIRDDTAIWIAGGVAAAGFWAGQYCVFLKMQELYDFHPPSEEAQT
jgi:hypothetical protein